eukprot:TRINITY_DN3833_c0_g1_i2.p1 TRINITY_DN3833_c0_g1~~TRINITY_DN3833_c0_g1_i2.p1  ORF type:complete len:439 (-),score=136.50 TRINITY_DN3833_c0_g1_i2:261-1577(-)
MATDSSAPEIQLSGDSGLKKQILREGQGERRPTTGSEVVVHYVGRLLDGTVFDSSRDRNDYFTFNLGTGSVIKGWDEGIKTMRKGELALLTCGPDYAYGKRGSPPKIPPNATLQFEVELFSWSSLKDISERKDKGIMKAEVKQGEGYQTPKDEARCVINLVGKVLPADASEEDEEADGEVFERRENYEVVIGEGQLTRSLEKCLENMRQGEHATFILAPRYAYGAAGDASLKVPPNARLRYDVELVSMVSPQEPWDLDANGKIHAAEKRKNEGNELFKQGKHDRAIAKYRRGTSFIDADHSFQQGDELTRAHALKATLYLNIAACEVSRKSWDDVIENCNQALKLGANNFKALLRRGKAYNERNEWDLAKQDLKQALELDPASADAKRELAAVNKKIADHDKKDRQAYSGMFERMSKMEQKETKPTPAPSAAGESSDK